VLTHSCTHADDAGAAGAAGAADAASSMPKLPVELRIEDFMTGSSPDPRFFQEEEQRITVAASAFVQQLLFALNHSACLAVCAVCDNTACKIVGTRALCEEHSTPYEYSTHLPVRCHVCPHCHVTVRTGQVFQDLSSPTPFEPDLPSTATLHKDAIDAHNDVCEQFPITVCEGVNKLNMHEHVCENPRCSIMLMKKKE